MDKEEVVLSCMFFDYKEEYLPYSKIERKWFNNKALFDKIVKYKADGLPNETSVQTKYYTKEEMSILLLGSNKVSDFMNSEYFYKQLISARIQEAMYRDMKDEVFDPKKYWKILKELSEENVDINAYDFSNDIIEYLAEYEELSNGNYEKFHLGLQGVDEVIGNVRTKSLITFGANSGVGKSNIMMKVMGNLLEKNVRCLYLSAEMGFPEIIERMVAMKSDLSLFKIRNHMLNPEEKKAYADTVKKNVYGKYCKVLEIAKFDNSKIKKLIGEFKPKFVFIDYIQRFNMASAKNLSRAAILSDIVNELKTIAIEHDVVVVTASQMNRTADRTNVSIDALKETGGIEEASDIVILMSTIDDTAREKSLRINVAKNRNGVTDRFVYVFDKRTCEMRYSEEFTFADKEKKKKVTEPAKSIDWMNN